MLRHNVWTGHIPRPIWVVGLVFVLVLSAFGLTLKDEVEVTCDQIYLKDIIEEAREDSSWGEISVLPSPSIGSKRSIYKSFVVTVFRQNGYFTEAANLTGPNKVDVKRELDTTQNLEVSRQIDYERLWSEVSQQISAYLDGLIPEGFKIRITLESFPEINSSKNIATVSVDLSVFRNSHSGRMIVPVQLLLEDGGNRRVLFSVNIGYEGEVFVAKKDFRPREKLDGLRLSREIRTFSSSPNDCFLPEYEIGKYQSKSYIRAGDILLTNNIELSPIKNRGEITKLYYQIGTITVEVTVQLLEDAVLGKLVKAKNLSSEKELQGIVQLDGTLVFSL